MFSRSKRYAEESLRYRFATVFGAVRTLMSIFGATIVGVACVFAVLVCFQLRKVPDLNSLRQYHGADSIQIYDAKDQLVCSVPLGNSRIMVPLSQVPKPVQLAALAAEDHRFYEHPGLDFTGMIRAGLANLQAHKLKQGGSTITQQLVKNLFFSEEKRNFDRKIAEMLVAIEIERRYSKDEILSMYLNEIYFGNGANGIEQASLRYFGKDVSQLSIAEGAYLAGLIRAPSYFGAPEHRPEAFARQWQVLDAMVDDQYITLSECHVAKNTVLSFKTVNARIVDRPFHRYPYYVSFILDFVRNRFSEAEMRQGGLRVYTNLDQTAQETAERTLAREIAFAPRGVTNEALISISVKDAAIRAIVGGARDYWGHQWNSATNPHTVGSLFKPFVYLTAFLEGILDPNSTVEDAPITIHFIDGVDYSPQNFDHKFLGKITVREALAQSRNVCAKSVAQQVGIDQVVETARLAGIRSKLPKTLSLALGSAAISPLELAGAYGTFARGGVNIVPWAVRRIEDWNGHTLISYAPIISRAFPMEPVCWLVDVLKDVVGYGTGTQAKLLDRPVAGKTGTADKSRDIWFVGFTSDMVTAVWGGNDQNLPIVGHNVTGGSVMARVWRDYNRDYYAKSHLPPDQLIVTGSYGSSVTAGRTYKRPTSIQAPQQTDEASGQIEATQNTPRLPTGTSQSHKGVTEYTWGR